MSFVNAIRDENRTLATQVYAAIKEAILSLDLKPGTPLTEEELAAQLGTSKTPVRNALVKLEQEGLVVRIPYKGTYVSEITQQDVREIFELRAVLEGLAGRLAVPQLSPDELILAGNILDESEKALECADLVRATALGEEFHKLIYKRTSNQRLLVFLRMLDDQLHRLRLISNSGIERLKKSAIQHRAILAALKDGDSRLVEKTLKDHHYSVLEDLTLDSELKARD